VWLESEPPAAARCLVYVKDYTHPVVGIALWSEYAQIGRDGKPQALWASKPALMLAKCAEALALRKAYPQDLSGLYTTDELPEAEQDEDGVTRRHHHATDASCQPP
jgi:phage recombination protein Bet